MSKQKIVVYEGSINRLVTPKLLINIDFVKSGDYELQLIHKGKVLRRVYFTKP